MRTSQWYISKSGDRIDKDFQTFGQIKRCRPKSLSQNVPPVLILSLLRRILILLWIQFHFEIESSLWRAKQNKELRSRQVALFRR